MPCCLLTPNSFILNKPYFHGASKIDLFASNCAKNAPKIVQFGLAVLEICRCSLAWRSSLVNASRRYCQVKQFGGILAARRHR